MLKPEAVFSVAELNTYVNLLLGNDVNLASITVRGEISGFKRHTSGHLYFTLKDETASVRAVMFKYNALRLTFFPKDGLSVTVSGRVGLYEKDGSFQLYADSMRVTGEGDLYRKFIQYKNELEKRGWFDAALKKEIPFLPKAVGVITSASGAAIEDIRKVIGRRFPSMPILLYPASVQGNTAAAEIAAAIRRADAEHTADVLIVGRGGGSLEDLWAFNEPAVAEAVHQCALPVISAVGHEIDFSICDFVADLRAATPSAAAELAVPELEKLFDTVAALRKRLSRSLLHGTEEKQARLLLLKSRPCFSSPQTLLDRARQRLSEAEDALQSIPVERVAAFRNRLAAAGGALRGFSPSALLERGFLLAENSEGKRICSATEIRAGDALSVIFHDGTVHTMVTEIQVNTNM